jgi:NADH-quinone oxidoreductase subunit D
MIQGKIEEEISEETEAAEETVLVEEVELDFGPRHPALHGVLRLRIKTDGDTVLDAAPVLGHQHRGIEKLFEIHPWERNVPLAGRLDLAASLACVGAVEKLLGLVVPPRARFVRTLLAELHRLASHLLWLATHAGDVGPMAPADPALRGRELILDLFGALGGSPGAPDLLLPGGLARDLPAGWTGRCGELMEALPGTIDEIEGLLTENRLWKKRTVGIGVLPPEVALDLGVTGPLLRASGIAWDLRRNLPGSQPGNLPGNPPGEAWGEVAFEIPLGKNGDCYDRYQVRVGEMRQSVGIVRQCLEKLPDGAVLARRSAGSPDLPLAERGAEVYHGVEGPRGEVGFHLVADGFLSSTATGRPVRCHVRSPSFAHLQALPALCRGARIADLVTLVGTLDVSLVEADR